MKKVITKTVEVPVPVVERIEVEVEVEKIVIVKEVEFVDRPVLVSFFVSEIST